MTLVPGDCSTSLVLDPESTAPYRSVTIAFKINANFNSPVQNHVDTQAWMNTGWRSYYVSKSAYFGILPVPADNAITTATTSLDNRFFKEGSLQTNSTRNNNDANGSGRGSVDISWNKNDQADGYYVKAFDGHAYRTVATLPNNNLTHWTSKNAGIYPKDSAYKQAGEDSITVNPFAGAQAPAGSGSPLTLTQGGATSGSGLVVSDSTHLYTHRWGGLPGSHYFESYSKTGEYEGKINYAFDSEILSALCLDGALYSGTSLNATTLEGVLTKQVSADADAPTVKPITFTFDKPLLNLFTGAEITGAAQTMLCANDDYIFSLGRKGSANTENGFNVRIYDTQGRFVADKQVSNTATGNRTYGVIADADNNLYVLEWAGVWRTTKIATFAKDGAKAAQVTGAWTLDRSVSRGVNGCYDATDNTFYIGSIDKGTISSFAGTGLDLKDNPNALYKATAGDSYDDHLDYTFRIVPYNSVGENDSYYQPAVYDTTLDNRTVYVNPDTRHSDTSIGKMVTQTGFVRTDTGALILEGSDAQMTTYGPDVSVQRVYDSQVATDTATLFAPGMHFDFEQTLKENTAGNVTYTDEAGDTHLFVRQDDTRQSSGTVYVSPQGNFDTLNRAGSGWRLVFADKSATVFDSQGRISARVDRAGNQVDYSYDLFTGRLSSITAANGQVLHLTYSDAGGLTSIVGTGVDVSYRMSADGTYEIADNLSGLLTEFSYDADGHLSAVASQNAKVHYALVLDVAGMLKQTENDSDKVFPTQEKTPSYLHTYAYSTTLEPAGVKTSTLDITTPLSAQRCIVNGDGTLAVQTNEVDPKDDLDTAPATTYSYNACAQTIKETGPVAGAESTWVYDIDGHETAACDAAGRVAKSYYNGAGDLIKKSEPNGALTWYDVNEYGDTTQETALVSNNQDKAKTCYTYEYSNGNKGRLVSQKQLIATTPDKTWAQTDYADFDPVTGEAKTTINRDILLSPGGLPQDITTTQAFDGRGNEISSTDASGTTLTKTYDAASRLIREESAQGAVSETKYDVLGNTVETKRVARDGGVADWTRTVYDGAGNAVCDTSLSSQEETLTSTVHSFDAPGQETVADASDVAGVEETTYTPDGLEATSKDEGLPANDLAKQITTYDAQGNAVSSKEAGSSKESLTAYNVAGEVTTETAADHTTTGYTYDEDTGELEQQSASAFGGTTARTGFDYDLVGNVVAQTEPDAAKIENEYDLLGRLTSTKIEDSKTTTFVYNALGWVIEMHETFAPSTEIGAPKTNTSIVTKYTYDKLGNVVQTTQNGEDTTNVYDAAGDLIACHNADGSSVENTYDDFGRLIASKETATDGTLAHDTAYTYDALSRQLSAIDTASKHGKTSTYDKDGSSTLKETTTLGTYMFGTDTSQRQVTSKLSLSGETSATLESHTDTDLFDDAGRATQFSSTLFGFSWGTAFDETGRLKTLSTQTTDPASLSYGYDQDNGKISQETAKGDTATRDTASTFAYDVMGRITTSTAPVIADTATVPVDTTTQISLSTYVQKSSALQSTTVSYAPRMPVYSVSAQSTPSAVFDTSGRRTHDTVGARSRSYTWAGQRLISCDTSHTAATYTYDAAGQRLSATLSNETSEATKVSYTYDGLDLLGLSSTGTSETTYALSYLYDGQGSTARMGVFSQEGTSTPFFIQTNARGDVIALRDRDGATFATYSYEVYGAPKTQGTSTCATDKIPADLAQGIATAQILRYAGYTYDETSGLSYCSQRYYDPLTQAFISLDPAQADGQRSGYLYCAGDPVNNVDNSGLYAHAFVPSKGEQTSYFTKVLKVNAGTAYTRRIILAGHHLYFGWFAYMVRERGPWDFKRTVSKKSSRAHPKPCKFKGKNISMEDFGNINYGYTGAAMGMPLPILYAASFAVALKTSKGKGEKSDRIMIKQGFNLYYKMGKIIRPPWKVDKYIYPGHFTARGF